MSKYMVTYETNGPEGRKQHYKEFLYDKDLIYGFSNMDEEDAYCVKVYEVKPLDMNALIYGYKGKLDDALRRYGGGTK